MKNYLTRYKPFLDTGFVECEEGKGVECIKDGFIFIVRMFGLKKITVYIVSLTNQGPQGQRVGTQAQANSVESALIFIKENMNQLERIKLETQKQQEIVESSVVVEEKDLEHPYTMGEEPVGLEA